jgi:hypothetical protein
VRSPTATRVLKGGIGVVPGLDKDGDHDGADLVVLVKSDRSANSLHDVDLGSARVNEGDTVEGGDVDPLAETSGVCQQASFPNFEGTEVTRGFERIDLSSHLTRRIGTELSLHRSVDKRLTLLPPDRRATQVLVPTSKNLVGAVKHPRQQPQRARCR